MSVHVFMFFLIVSSCNAQPFQPSQFVTSRTANPFGEFDFNNQLIQSHGRESNSSSNSVQNFRSQVVRHGTPTVQFQNQQRDPISRITGSQSMGWDGHLPALQGIHSNNFQSTNFERSTGNQQSHQFFPFHDSQTNISNINSASNNIPDIPAATNKPRTLIRVDRQPTSVFPTAERVPIPNVSAVVSEIRSLRRQILEPKKNLTVPISQGITSNIQATSHNIDMISNIINHLSNQGILGLDDDQLMNQMVPQNIGHPTLTEQNANLVGQQFSVSDVMQIQSNPNVNMTTNIQNQINYNPNQLSKTHKPNNFSSFGNQVLASTKFKDSFSMQGIPIDVDDDHMSRMLAKDGGVSHSAISFPVLKEVTARNIGYQADATFSNVGTSRQSLPIIGGGRLPGKENNQIHFASQSQSGIVVSDIPMGSDTFDIPVFRKNVTLFKIENVNHSHPQAPTRVSAHLNDKAATLSQQQQGKIYQMPADNTSATQMMNFLNNHENYRLNLVGPHIFQNSVNNQEAHLTTLENHRVVDQSLRVNVSGNTFVNQQNVKSGQNEIDNKNSNTVASDSANSLISTNTMIQPANQEIQVNQTHAGFHLHQGSGNGNVVMSRHSLESSNKLSVNNNFNMESNSQNPTTGVHIGSRGDNLTFANIPFQTHLLGDNIGSVMNSNVFLDDGQVYPNQVKLTAQSNNLALDDISLNLQKQLELLPVTNIRMIHLKEEPTKNLKLVRIESDAGDYFKWVHPTLSTSTLISDPEAEEEEATVTIGTSTKSNTTPITTTTTTATTTTTTTTASTTTKNLPSKLSCTADTNSLTNGCRNKKHSITNEKSMQNMTISAEPLLKITSRNISKIENQNIIRRIAKTTKLLEIVSDSTVKEEHDASGRVGAILNKEVTPVHINIKQPLTSIPEKPQNRSSENTTLEKTGHPVNLLNKPNKELNLEWIDPSTYGNHTLLELSKKTSHIVPPTFSLPLSLAPNNVPDILSALNKDINEPLNVNTEPVLIGMEPGQQTLHRQIRLKSNSSERPNFVNLNMQTTAKNSQRAPSVSTKIHIGPMPIKPNHSILPIFFKDASNIDKNSSTALNQTRHIQSRTIRDHKSEESNKERVPKQQIRTRNNADNNISVLVQQPESASQNGRYGNNLLVPTSISFKMKSYADRGHESKQNKTRNGEKADNTTTLKQDRQVSAAFTVKQKILSVVNTETRTPPTSQSTYSAVGMKLGSITQIQLMNNILELRNRIERAVKLKTPDRLIVMNLMRRLNHFTQTIRNTTVSVAKQIKTSTASATINITIPTTTANEGGENEMEEENIYSTVSTITKISSAGTTTENVGEIEVEAEDIISSTSYMSAITTTPTSTTTTSETEAAEVENELEVEDLAPTTTTVRKVYSTHSITKPITTTVSINIFANTVNQQVGSVTSSSARKSENGIYGQSYLAPEVKVLSAEAKGKASLPQMKHSMINTTKLSAGVNKILKAIGHEKRDKVDSTKIQLQKIGDTIVIKVNPVEKVNSSVVLDNRGIISPKLITGDHSQQRLSLDSTPQTINRPSTSLKIFKEMQMKKMNRPPSTRSTSMRSNVTKPDIHQLSRQEIVETFDGNTEKTRVHETTTQGHNGQTKPPQRMIEIRNANLGHDSHHNRQIQTTSGIRKQNPGQDIENPQHKNKLRPKPLPVPKAQLRRLTNPSRPPRLNQTSAESLKVKVNLSNITANNKDRNDIKISENILRSEYQHRISETSVALSPNLHVKHGEAQRIPFNVNKRNETRPGPEMKPKTNLRKALISNSGQKNENLDRKIINDGTASQQLPIYVGSKNTQTESEVNKANKITESVAHKRPSSNESQSVKLLPPRNFVSSFSALTRSTPISITKSQSDKNEKVSQNQRSEIIKQSPSLHAQRKSLKITFQNSSKGGKLGPSDVRENTQMTQMQSKDNRSSGGVKEGPRQLSSEQGPRVMRLDPPRGRLSHPNRQLPTLGGESPSTNRSELKPEGNDAIRHHRTTTTNSNLMQSVLSSPLRKLEEIRLKHVRGNIRSEQKNLISLEHKTEITTSLPAHVIPVSATEHPIKTDEEGLTDNRYNYDMATIHEGTNNLLITSEYDITTSASERRMRGNKLSGEVRDSFYSSSDLTRDPSRQSVSVHRNRPADTVQNSKPVHAMNSIDAQKRFRQERPSVRPNRQGRQMGPFRPRRPLISYERRNGETNRERYTGTSLRDAFSNRHKQNEHRPPQFAFNSRQNKMLPRMNLPRESQKLPTQPNVSAEEGGEEGGGAGGEGEGEGGSVTSTTTFDTFRYRNVGTTISVPYWSSSPSRSVHPHYRGKDHDQQSSRRHNNQQEWIQHRLRQRTSAWNNGQVYHSPTGNTYVERSLQDRRPHHSELSGYDRHAQYDMSSNVNNKATEQYNYNPRQRGGTDGYQGGDRQYSSGGMETSTLWNENPHEWSGTTTYSW